MWTIIKFNKKKLAYLKDDLKVKLGEDLNIYIPKMFIQKYRNNKFVDREFDLLGNYLFCFHEKFKDPQTISNLKFTRGLKYFLNGFNQSQNEIRKFIEKCKSSEDKNGYLSQNFFELCINSKYKFYSGPFAETIFKIIDLQKNKINILLGNIKTTINKNKFLFSQL